jgi:hypothetical protein
MPLAGTFDVLDFDEVMSLLSKRSATGRLQLRTGSMHGVIWLADGKATAAEIGTSTGGETRTKWRSQLDEICFDALRSPRGSFEFNPEDAVSVPAGPRVELEDLLANARRRLEIWQDVESVIHSFEAVPRLAEALTDESLTLSQDRWKVLVSIDGRRNISALAKRLDTELLEFCQLLKPLVESGAVILDQPEGWLKSLPKVRLEVSAPGEIDPSLVVDADGPEDGMSVVNVNSTPVPLNSPPGTPATAVARAGITNGNGGGHGPGIARVTPASAAGAPVEAPAADPTEAAPEAAEEDSPEPPRRRLRGRGRGRSGENHS